MSGGTAYRELVGRLSKPPAPAALLVLEDGSVFEGRACGALGETWGEICFNTSLEGYLEVITDPSYAGQIVVMTYPQLGNYGVCSADAQSTGPLALRGLVLRDMCCTPSNWRSDMSLQEFLEREGVVAIEGVDTRALVRHIRELGAMRAIISTTALDPASLLAKVRATPSLVGANLVATLHTTGRDRSASHSSPEGTDAVGTPPASSNAASAPSGDSRQAESSPLVVVYDCGVKQAILDCLRAQGCRLVIVPWDTPASEVLALQPDGVFLSNGPGDPEAVDVTYAQVEQLLGKLPVFGICLGHQMISLAAGGRIIKLKYGHHGGNQPVMDLLTGRVEVTVQNHGFNLDFPSLGPLVPQLSGGLNEHPDDLMYWVRAGIAPVVDNPRFGRVRLSHVNLNDGSAEGIAFLDTPAFCVQYHPEACPGPTDSRYLFARFMELMRGGGHAQA